MSDKKQLWKYAAGSVLLLASGYVLASSGAGDIGTVAAKLTGTMKSITALISAGSYVAGVALALAGLVKFKAHKEAPTQTALSVPLVLLAIAAGLVFLPSVIDSVGTSLFGNVGAGGKADSSGSGL